MFCSLLCCYWPALFVLSVIFSIQLLLLLLLQPLSHITINVTPTPSTINTNTNTNTTTNTLPFTVDMVWQATVEELRYSDGSSHTSIWAQRRSRLDWRDAPSIRWFMFKWWRYDKNFDLLFCRLFVELINVTWCNCVLCVVCVVSECVLILKMIIGIIGNLRQSLLYCYSIAIVIVWYINQSNMPSTYCVCASIYAMTNITVFPFIFRTLSSLFFSSHNICPLLLSQIVLIKGGVF